MDHGDDRQGHGIAFPRWWSRTPEIVLWTGVEDAKRSFDDPSASSPESYLEIAYYGGRRRRITQLGVRDYDQLERAILAELEKRKAAPPA